MTPAEVHGAIRSLIDELVPGATPHYVDVMSMGAKPNECFVNVQAIVAKQGGEMVTGWSLWEAPSVFVEAEFHGVWRSPNGQLIDPTPKNSPTRRILFIADPTRQYSDRQVNNVRRAVSADPRVQAFLNTFDAEFELLNAGDLADKHGQIELVGDTARRFQLIQDERGELFVEIQGLYPSLGPYLPCPCGSGKKMRWCHRNALTT